MAVASAINRGENLLGRLVLPPPARRENHQAGPIRHTRRRFVCFLKAMRLHSPAAVEAAGPTDAGKEQAQQVVEAGQGRDRGPWALVAGPSRQREGRGQAVDAADLGHAQCAPAASLIQRREKAPARLGVNRVQYEGSLARSGRAAEGDEGFVGQVQGDGAQVVFAGFPDD